MYRILYSTLHDPIQLRGMFFQRFWVFVSFGLCVCVCVRLGRVMRDDGGADGVHLKKDNLFFAHGDIMSAKTFDPFTHVYMFDVGE